MTRFSFVFKLLTYHTKLPRHVVDRDPWKQPLLWPRQDSSLDPSIPEMEFCRSQSIPDHIHYCVRYCRIHCPEQYEDTDLINNAYQIQGLVYLFLLIFLSQTNEEVKCKSSIITFLANHKNVSCHLQVIDWSAVALHGFK